MAQRKHNRAENMAFVDHIKEVMGEDHIVYWAGRYYVVFDRNAIDWEIVPGMRLHQFLTKEPGDGFTRLEAKLFVHLKKVIEMYGKEIKILETYRSPERCRYKHEATRKGITEGSAIIIRPKRINDMKKLERACRKTKAEVGFFFFQKYIVIESTMYRRWREVDPWGDVKPSSIDPLFNKGTKTSKKEVL